MSRFSILALAVLILAGCGGRRMVSVPTVGDEKVGPSIGRLPDRPYRLRNGDLLEIGVWGEDDMTRRLTVGPDGRISYYKATEIMAACRTLEALRETLKEELAKDFRNPEKGVCT